MTKTKFAASIVAGLLAGIFNTQSAQAAGFLADAVSAQHIGATAQTTVTAGSAQATLDAGFLDLALQGRIETQRVLAVGGWVEPDDHGFLNRAIASARRNDGVAQQLAEQQ